MTYIILAAGKGTELRPLTAHYPKVLYKLDKKNNLLLRMVRSIRCYDKEAEIAVVTGYMYKQVAAEIEDENVKLIYNPFYEVTNSIASLWFARQYLERENVTIINGDIVLSDDLVKDVIVKTTDKPYALVDSDIKDAANYNVFIQNDKISIMSRNLTEFSAKYASVTKLDPVSSRLLKRKVDQLVNEESYNEIYETALVQMVFENDFDFYYNDIRCYLWTEVNSIDDLVKAKEIHNTEERIKRIE